MSGVQRDQHFGLALEGFSRLASPTFSGVTRYDFLLAFCSDMMCKLVNSALHPSGVAKSSTSFAR